MGKSGIHRQAIQLAFLISAQSLPVFIFLGLQIRKERP